MPEKNNTRYLGGEVIAGSGATVNAPGLPRGVTTIIISARGGPIYATINGNAGATISPIHVSDGQTLRVGPYDNIRSLGVWGAVDDFAHLLYEGESLP